MNKRIMLTCKFKSDSEIKYSLNSTDVPPDDNLGT